MNLITSRIYSAVAAAKGHPVGPTDVARYLGLNNSQTVKNWEDRGPSCNGFVLALEREIRLRWLTQGEEPMFAVSPASMRPTLPVAVKTLADAIGTLSTLERKALADELAILALAPDSVATQAKVLAAIDKADKQMAPK